jgi:hypothetical protein
MTEMCCEGCSIVLVCIEEREAALATVILQGLGVGCHCFCFCSRVI